VGIPPHIILTGNSTDSNGNVVYKLGGLAAQNLLLAVDKMNATVVFLKPSVSLVLYNSFRELGKIPDGKSDILIGPLPLLPAFLSPTIQLTFPYDYTAAKWFVPCPKPVAIIEMAMMTLPTTRMVNNGHCPRSNCYIMVGFG
jgi:hypothetical protein